MGITPKMRVEAKLNAEPVNFSTYSPNAKV